MISAPAKVKPGDFGLVPMGPGFVARSIRLGQLFNGDGFTDYEHAFIYLGSDQVMQAEPKGANLAQFSYGNVLWSSGLITLTDNQRSAVCDAARSYIGTPYSFLDYFALASHRLGLWTPGLQKYVTSSKHMICSQLVDKCYEDAGVHLFTDGRWPGYVTPGMLAELLYQKVAN